MGEQGRGAHGRHEPVRDRLAEPVSDLGVDDLPRARRGGIHLPLSERLAFEHGRAGAERVAPRILGPVRNCLRVDLMDLVDGTVDVEIEARAEEVLVVRRSNAGRDDVRELRLRARFDRHRRDDARQLDLELDVSVEVQVPEEAVLVVADRREVAHDESPTAPHLAGPAPEVDVLPEHAVVLLVHADRVVDDPRLTLLVGERRVEVMDLAEAVATERERLGHAPEAPLPRVERVLPTVQGARISVGDDHLGDRGAVHDRAGATVVVVGDAVQHQPFVGIEPDAEREGSPLHEVAVDGEARSFGLGDLEGLESGAQRFVVGCEVPRVLGRQGGRPVVDHLDDLVAAQIEVDDQPLDRAGVAVVRRDRCARRRCTERCADRSRRRTRSCRRAMGRSARGRDR